MSDHVVRLTDDQETLLAFASRRTSTAPDRLLAVWALASLNVHRQAFALEPPPAPVQAVPEPPPAPVDEPVGRFRKSRPAAADAAE